MGPIPHPVPIRRNDHHEDGNDIRPNDNANGINNFIEIGMDNFIEIGMDNFIEIGRDNRIEIENHIIPNGDAFRENNHLENEDDIEPNNVIGGDNHIEVENNIIPNHFNEGENQGENVRNGYAIRDPEGEGQDVMSSICIPLNPFSL